jgi:hypothetical protein
LCNRQKFSYSFIKYAQWCKHALTLRQEKTIRFLNNVLQTTDKEAPNYFGVKIIQTFRLIASSMGVSLRNHIHLLSISMTLAYGRLVPGADEAQVKHIDVTKVPGTAHLRRSAY